MSSDDAPESCCDPTAPCRHPLEDFLQDDWREFGLRAVYCSAGVLVTPALMQYATFGIIRADVLWQGPRRAQWLPDGHGRWRLQHQHPGGDPGVLHPCGRGRGVVVTTTGRGVPGEQAHGNPG